MKYARVILLCLLLAACAIQGASAASGEATGNLIVDQFPRIPLKDRTQIDVSDHTYYKVEPGNYTWRTAEAICEKQGAHLVTITTLEEAALVMQITEGEIYGYWIGADYRSVLQDREWVTGECFDYAWLDMIDQEQYWGDDPAWLMKFGKGGYAWYAGEDLEYTMTLPDGTRGERYEAGFIMEWDETVRELFVTLPEDEKRQEYTGKQLYPKPIVTDQDGNTLVEGADYTLSYENNIKPGEGRVLVSGEIGGYTDGEAEFEIVPRPVKDLEVINYTGSIELKWTPREEADAYEVVLYPEDETGDFHTEWDWEGTKGKLKIRRDYLKYGHTYHLEIRSIALLDEEGAYKQSDPATISQYYRESYLEIKTDTNRFRHNSNTFGIREGELYPVSEERYAALTANMNAGDANHIHEFTVDNAEKTWGGACHGLALAIAERKAGYLDISGFEFVDDEGVPCNDGPHDFYHLAQPGDNPPLKDWINYYWISQQIFWGYASHRYNNVGGAIADRLSGRTDGESLMDVMSSLVGEMQADTDAGVPIPFCMGWLVGPVKSMKKDVAWSHAHTLLLCGIDFDDEDYYVITVYNENTPDGYCYLFVSKDNPTHFAFSSKKEKLEKIDNATLPSYHDLLSHIYYYTPADLKRIQSKAVNTGAAAQNRSSGNALISVSAGVPFSVTNELGQELVFDGESLTGDITVEAVRYYGEEELYMCLELPACNRMDVNSEAEGLQISCHTAVAGSEVRTSGKASIVFDGNGDISVESATPQSIEVSTSLVGGNGHTHIAGTLLGQGTFTHEDGGIQLEATGAFSDASIVSTDADGNVTGSGTIEGGFTSAVIDPTGDITDVRPAETGELILDTLDEHTLDASTCPFCGYRIKEGTSPSFCTNCGASLSHSCPFCGYQFADGALPAYCTDCGAQLAPQ